MAQSPRPAAAAAIATAAALLTSAASYTAGGSCEAHTDTDTDTDTDTAVPTERALLAGVTSLAGQLFHSVGMQLSVPHYFAEYTVRGANLDTALLPLNNGPYLLRRFAEVQEAPANASQATQWAALRALLEWEQPGEGGFYDDLGQPGRQPHLVMPAGGWEADPDYYASPLTACAIARDLKWQDRLEKPPAALPVGPRGAEPVQWQTVALAFYNAPLIMRYEGLKPACAYSLLIVYANPNVYSAVGGGVANGVASGGLAGGLKVGSTPAPLVALSANGVVVHPPLEPPAQLQRTRFELPPAALANNSTRLELVFTMPAGVGGSGTGCHVSEVVVQCSC
jgi:hypothetical protein